MILEFVDNALIILCGPAGGGKSYFAGKFFAPCQVVSSDQCRAMVCDDQANQAASADAFELFFTIIGFRLKHNRLAVADATNLSAPYRSRLRQIASSYNKPAYLVVFTTQLDQCLRNNNLRDCQVERYVIEDHTAKLQTALKNIPNEPYQHVYNLTSTDTNDLHVQITPASPCKT